MTDPKSRGDLAPEPSAVDASEILRQQLPPLMKRSEQLGQPILTMLLGRAYERIMRSSQALPGSVDKSDKPG